MKKIYLLLLACFAFQFMQAQKISTYKGRAIPLPLKRGSKPGLNGLAGGCDTLNLSVLDDSAVIYLADPSIGKGFFTGVNSYFDLGNAQYFDASSLSDNYVTEAYIYFGVANTKTVSKTVPVNVYDGTGGSPGALLATTNLSMQTIINDVNQGVFSHIVFNPAVQLPASKQFFLGVDYSNLNLSTRDSLAVVSTLFGQSTGAWENINSLYLTPGGWHSYYEGWSVNFGLFMFPLLSANQTCTAMPVHLTSFTAQAKETSVLLNWQVTQEVNMKQYDVERAGSNLQFVYAGTVPATNSSLNHTYGYTDANAVTSASSDLFYRLKQINADGNISYSNIIRVPIAGGILTAKVVNPFHNVIQVNVTSPIAQTLQAAVYDVQGRKVANLDTKLLGVGDNSISMPTGPLPKGIYILNLSTGTAVYKYKIINN